MPNAVLLAPYALDVQPARTLGRLYSLGSYPGLVPGPDSVTGELVALDPAGEAAVLALLDELEGYVPERPLVSMYVRRHVPVTTAGGRWGSAWAYLYNRPVGNLPLVPGGCWTGPMAPAAGVDPERDAFAEHVRTYPTRVRRGPQHP